MKLLVALYSLCMLAMLTGCQGSIASMAIAYSYPTSPRNYLPAGYSNAEEVYDYAANAEYFAFKISTEEWRAFYDRFPEYWNDIQKCKQYTFMPDYNSGYTAYALRWNMVKSSKNWDHPTVQRLKSKGLEKGDDIYKIVFAKGAPKRIIWDNDFDILIFDDDTAAVLKENKVDSAATCPDCTKTIVLASSKYGREPQKTYIATENDVLRMLQLSRPSY